MQYIRFFIISISFIVLCSSVQIQHAVYKALIVVPITDLVTEPLSVKNNNVEQAYKDIPVSWGPLHYNKSICPRQHQALFNEIVRVIETREKEVCIEITNAFSETTRTKQPQELYWTLKKNICPLHVIPQAIQHYIPEPIDYNNNNIYQVNLHVITLNWPFYDSVTQQRYSAGTRFVYDGIAGDLYVTYIYDYMTHSMRKIMIPIRYAVIGAPENVQMRIANFVKLLRKWANVAGFIPFVWGGISFAKRNEMEGFLLKYVNDIKKQQRAYWQLNKKSNSPHSGFDASGLILRAAQIYSIPYFFKNTTTAMHHIRHMKLSEVIQEGDLIWVPGGLFVVSNLLHNKLIGTIGYQHGFGKIVECSLSQIFKGINSYDDFARAYKDQRPLSMKNSSEKIYNTVTQYAILKLKSLFEN